MNVALECRFTRGSEQLMSPAYMGEVDDGSLYCWMEVTFRTACCQFAYDANEIIRCGESASDVGPLSTA